MSERESDELFPFLPGRWSAAFVFVFLGLCIAVAHYAGWLSVPESLRSDYAYVVVGFFAWLIAMSLQRRAGFPDVDRRRLWWRLAYALGVVAVGAFLLGRGALGVAPVPILLAAMVWTTLTAHAPPTPDLEATEPRSAGAEAPA